MKTKILFLAAVLAACALGVNAQTKKGETAKQNAKTETVFHISNMHGEHCKKIITENLAYEKGVKDLKFDLDKQNLAVVYDANKTSPDLLQKALEKLGYDAKNATADNKTCHTDGAKTEQKSCCRTKH